MDEWQLEMQEIQRRLAQLKAHDGDPVIIDELEAELRILDSFYLTSLDVLEAGMRDVEAQRGLQAERWGEWNLRNVYSFVYDLSMDLPAEPGRDLAAQIDSLDFAGSLLEVLEDS